MARSVVYQCSTSFTVLEVLVVAPSCAGLIESIQGWDQGSIRVSRSASLSPDYANTSFSLRDISPSSHQIFSWSYLNKDCMESPRDPEFCATDWNNVHTCKNWDALIVFTETCWRVINGCDQAGDQPWPCLHFWHPLTDLHFILFAFQTMYSRVRWV